jgi:hypothetical protein
MNQPEMMQMAPYGAIELIRYIASQREDKTLKLSGNAGMLEVAKTIVEGRKLLAARVAALEKELAALKQVPVFEKESPAQKTFKL